MGKVSNRKCIRRLGFRSMRAARTRNIVAVLAVALTTILFTSLFTIAASINYSFQQENFRQAGGDGHGTFKKLTVEQADQLRDDPLIRDSWTRLFVGMLEEVPFNKSHVEVSYIEPHGAPHYFCEPVEGRLPREGTDEAATDTRVLSLLGIKPELGARITLPVTIDGNTLSPRTVCQTFTLSGWWEYDSAVVASNVLLPRSAAEPLCELSNGDPNSFTGVWNLDVMFQNAMHIRENMTAVLEHSGYQCTEAGTSDYIGIGINWGYTGDQINQKSDPLTIIAIASILLLIIFTGYLIIYNVFQISVANDIRFYGLLKTIGTTGRQLRRIIRQQALLLSMMGIPLGLVIGFVTGNFLTPVIMTRLSYQHVFVTFNPWIFIGAAVFSLLTVFLSCARPGRMAARVSPVEAVRYTEGGGRRGVKRGDGGAFLPRMAWSNLGRSRSRTAVTVISLTLAVVLMDLVVTFVSGFDMEKYLQGKVVSDFLVGHADYFQTSAGFHSTDEAVPEEVISAIQKQGVVTEGGRVYGQESSIQTFVPEAFCRNSYSRMYSGEALDDIIADKERLDGDTVVTEAQVYGMEDFALSQLDVLEGDLAPLSDPAQNAVAASYAVDDYGEPIADSNCFHLGDTVTLRYISEWMYLDTQTGKEISGEEVDAMYERGEDRFIARPKTYEEKTYTVCALVKIPSAIGYRYMILGASQLVLGAAQFRQDSGMNSVMAYAFNTAEETSQEMDQFLSMYTESVQPLYDYESKQTRVAEFEGFRSMFLTLGSVLAGIIGLVGILNFINAVLTGIMSRKREMAVLQSVGMTGKQVKTMLVLEGLYYTTLSAALSLVLSAVLGLLAAPLTSVFWFFTYRFTVAPVLAVIPLFLLLGALVPLTVYRQFARATIVERLREAEA